MSTLNEAKPGIYHLYVEEPAIKHNVDELITTLKVPDDVRQKFRDDDQAEFNIFMGPDSWEVLINFSDGTSVSYGFNIKD